VGVTGSPIAVGGALGLSIVVAKRTVAVVVGALAFCGRKLPFAFQYEYQPLLQMYPQEHGWMSGKHEK
jgi:hypothetical protein